MFSDQNVFGSFMRYVKHGHCHVKDNEQKNASCKCENINNYCCRNEGDKNVDFVAPCFVADVPPEEGGGNAEEQGCSNHDTKFNQ
jgi:hypothetical protein